MPFWRRQEKRSVEPVVSIGDPALASYFGLATPSYAGVSVGETTALTLSAVFRAVSLISQSIAQLPLRTLRDVDGVRTRVGSFLDNPGGVQQTPFEWTETVLVHLLLHGNAYLLKVYNGGGGIDSLQPIHPLMVAVHYDPEQADNKQFIVTLLNGTTRILTSADLLHIPGISVDTIWGLSPITVARNSLGTAIAGDRAAAKMFSNGAMMSGFVTPDGDADLTEAEAKMLKEGLDRKAAGWENASTLAVFNKALKLNTWTMSMEDAQFLQSRQFQVQEIARWFGVPGNLLMDPGAVSTWGTGIEIQNRGMARTVLAPWAKRIEERLSTLLPAPRFVEFDFAGLERGSPAEETDLLIRSVQGGLITQNEARHVKNLPPLPGGDVLANVTKTAAPAAPAAPAPAAMPDLPPVEVPQ